MENKTVFLIEIQINGNIFWWTGNIPTFNESKIWTTNPLEAVQFQTKLQAHSSIESAGIPYNMNYVVKEHEFVNNKPMSKTMTFEEAKIKIAVSEGYENLEEIDIDRFPDYRLWCAYKAATLWNKYLIDRINELETAISKLDRGCNCSYDYRCSNCQYILNVKSIL
jgi:hypothetical protein